MEPTIIVCPVCKVAPCDRSAAIWDDQAQRDIYRISCMRCGDFSITGTEEHILSKDTSLSLRQRSIASSIIHGSYGATPLVDEYNWKNYFEKNDISILEKTDKLLLLIEKKVSSGNGFQRCVEINPDDLSLHAQCWAINAHELDALFMLLGEVKFLEYEQVGSIGYAVITAKGWERLEQLRTPNIDKAQGFVAMWFHSKMTYLFTQAIHPAIEAAGYSPHRVDGREHIDKIDDEIILQIRRSRFVVADMTGHRGGVYYEAGFAHGLGLPVFLTCKAGKKLHFDIRQYNCIFWEPDKLDEFRNSLARRIEAVLGRGPSPTS